MHSRLSPSKSHCWVHCPASVTMEERYGTGESSQSADEGTLVHEIAACMLTGKELPDNTKEQYKAAGWYVSQLPPGGKVEQPVQLGMIHPECFGTPDYVTDTGVYDLKYGYTQVEAEENWQLICYALSLPPSPTIELVICQPRPVPTVRRWEVAYADLTGKYLPRLQEAARLALAPNPPMRAGSHCRYCAGRAYCEAARQAAEEATVVAFSHRELSVEELATELEVLTRAEEALKYRKAALETQVVAALKAGKPVGMWSLQTTPGRLDWLVGVDEAITIASSLGVDISKPGLITPTQARKAGLPDYLLDTLAARKEGTTSLKLMDFNKMFKKE